MKIINKPLLKEYLPIKVFLDDLESIEELLSNAKNNYRIEAEKFEFPNVKELKQKYQNGTITDLKILSSNPCVSVEFHKRWARLYVGSDNNSEAGLFYKLDRIISSTTRRPSFLYSHYTIWIGYFVFMVLRLLSQEVIYQIVSILNYLLLTWALWVIYIRLCKHSEIILLKRHNIQSFLARNKDQLIVNLFTGSIGAALGVVGTVIAYKMGFFK